MKKYIFINVFLHSFGFVPAGTIIYDNTTHQTGFSYHKEYIENNFPPINPATLNWKTQKQQNFLFLNSDNFNKTFLELIPSVSDWSYKVLIARFPEFETMTIGDKLIFLESRTVGGLQSHLDKEEDDQSIKGSDWLEKIYLSSMDFYQDNIPTIPYHNAFIPLTTYGGMRPKCLYEDDEHNLWIAKFNTPDDDYNFSKMEMVCMDMAKDLNLPIAHSQLLSIDNNDIFLSYRFNKQGNTHQHSLPFFALSDNIHVEKQSEYSGKNPLILKEILNYSDFKNKDSLLLVQKFLLDIAVNNTDNHLKNIRLILNNQNLWEIAPLFDITMTPYIDDFVYNPVGLKNSEMYLNNPQLATHISNLFSIDVNRVQELIHNTQKIASNYSYYFEKNNLSENDMEYFSQGINIGLNKNNEALFKSTKNLKLSHYPKYKKF